MPFDGILGKPGALLRRCATTLGVLQGHWKLEKTALLHPKLMCFPLVECCRFLAQWCTVHVQNADEDFMPQHVNDIISFEVSQTPSPWPLLASDIRQLDAKVSTRIGIFHVTVISWTYGACNMISDATCWDFKVHRDRFQLSQSLSLSWKSALAYHGWAQSRPCVECSKKHRGVAGSCTLPRGFEYSHTSVTCHHGWFYTRKRRCSQGLLISVREWRETLTDTDTSVEDLQLPNPRSTRFRVLMSDLWRPKATHKYVHTHCWHPRNFKLRALRNALEMETWDETTSSWKTYTLRTLKEVNLDCNVKQKPIFGLESICCNSAVCKFARAATGSTISCYCILL